MYCGTILEGGREGREGGRVEWDGMGWEGGVESRFGAGKKA